VLLLVVQPLMSSEEIKKTVSNFLNKRLIKLTRPVGKPFPQRNKRLINKFLTGVSFSCLSLYLVGEYIEKGGFFYEIRM
jgi:hypothetical protein